MSGIHCSRPVYMTLKIVIKNATPHANNTYNISKASIFSKAKLDNSILDLFCWYPQAAATAIAAETITPIILALFIFINYKIGIINLYALTHTIIFNFILTPQIYE